MSNQSERDSAEGITGIETFGLWLLGYRGQLMASVPRQYGRLPGTKQQFREEFGDIVEHIPEILDPKSSLHLIDCLWVDVPASMQRVLQQQYPSAAADVEKKVNVMVENDRINFVLESPLVRNHVDTYGEFETRSGGLMLRILTTPTTEDQKGKWVVRKQKVRATLTDITVPDLLIEELIATMDYKIELQKATVNELQDVARFLEKSKHKAIVREFEHPS